jgi:hypothetical protein
VMPMMAHVPLDPDLRDEAAWTAPDALHPRR